MAFVKELSYHQVVRSPLGIQYDRPCHSTVQVCVETFCEDCCNLVVVSCGQRAPPVLRSSPFPSENKTITGKADAYNRRQG